MIAKHPVGISAAPFFSAIVSSFLLTACSGARQEPADLVVLEGAIATLDPGQPTAAALAVRGGKVAFVGSNEDAQKWIGERTQVLRVDGATVWPGLIDSHIHLMEGALSLDACSFKDEQLTLEQVAPIIRDCLVRTPGDGWVVVQDLNGAGFKADRKALDAIVADRPLVLWGADGHTAWVNSAALNRAGIDRNTKDPIDGRVDRDKTGDATGFLIDGAVPLVTSHLDKPTPERRESVLLRALNDIAAAGLTTIMEANTSEATIRTYVSLLQQQKLAARVTFALQSEGPSTDDEFARLKDLRALAEAHQPQLRADLIKLFADGVMEFPTQSAAMLEPYLDTAGKPTDNFGKLYIDTAPLTQFVQRADKEGFGVHIHAIGDRATRAALDAFAGARAQGSKRPYSISHLELVDAKDVPRFRELDVIASLQLQWAQPDNYSIDAIQAYIGPERHARVYPARSLQTAGATIAGGSDWNVSTFNPFEAMAVAMSRTNPMQPERGVLGANEEMTLPDMLVAYTRHAARMIGREAEVGSLEVGKAADFIVLDRKLHEQSSAADVRATRVVYTYINGQMQIGPQS